MTPTRAEICTRCECQFLQTTNPATGRHRKLCAQPSPDSRVWITMDAEFIAGPESNCPKGKWQGTAPQRKDLTNCGPCKKKLLEDMKDGNTSFRISVVIASLNERDDLTATVASVKHDCPDAEIIVVDDGSDEPEPVVTIRNSRRLGGPRSRRLGGLRATGDVVIFLDAHNALDWETACWFAKKYPEIGKVKPEFKEMLDKPGKLRTLGRAALLYDVIAYGRCMFSCARGAACLVPEKGLIGCRWMMRRPDLPKLELWPTSGLMGAFYAIPRTILDQFGGWPALPNFHGAQELAVALLAAAHKIPILHHDGVALWHLFRGAKTGVDAPFHTSMEEGSWLGYAAAWRLVLDDAHWKDYRARMAAGQGPHGEIPEQVLAQVETEEFNRYRADVQSRFAVKDSDELLEELNRRIAADRDARVQGAEDKVLNCGKKILLAITFCGEPITSSGPASLDEKREILGRCLESAKASGADEVVVFSNGAPGSPHNVHEVRDVHPNPGLALGEIRLVRAAIERAQREGNEWIVKCGADTFHPQPNWAKALVARGTTAPNGAALVAGICDSKCTVTKVFAARTDFLARTWPEEKEVAPLGPYAVIERVWTAKIVRLGLDKLWLKVPCKLRFEGSTNWWAPADPALRYEHTHVAAVAEKWRMKK